MVERTAILLIAGYVAALGLGIYEWNRTPSLLPPESEQRAQSLPPLEVPPIAYNSVAAYEAITERPLFTPTRRPQAAEEVKTGQTAAPKEQSTKIGGLRLAAVIRDADSTTVLLEDQSGQTRVLHQGERLAGWQIAEIHDDRVVMTSNTERKTLMVHQFDPVVREKKARRPSRRPSRRLPQRPSRLPEPAPRAESQPESEPDPAIGETPAPAVNPNRRARTLPDAKTE